ncbi:MAG: Gp138 family membrane-puncturing spike protein [Sporolactobacillus sp.]
MTQRHTSKFFSGEYSESLLMGLNTLAPGQVVSYDAGNHRANIQPLFMQKSKEGSLYKQSVIEGAPVLKHVESDISEGCLVFYVCAQRSLENLNGTQLIDPDSHKFFDGKDAVIVGVFDG